jgi:hypothetical protein
VVINVEGDEDYAADSREHPVVSSKVGEGKESDTKDKNNSREGAEVLFVSGDYRPDAKDGCRK